MSNLIPLVHVAALITATILILVYLLDVARYQLRRWHEQSALNYKEFVATKKITQQAVRRPGPGLPSAFHQ